MNINGKHCLKIWLERNKSVHDIVRKTIMTKCAPFIVMVWSHDRRWKKDRFFGGCWAAPKSSKILRRELIPPDPFSTACLLIGSLQFGYVEQNDMISWEWLAVPSCLSAFGFEFCVRWKWFCSAVVRSNDPLKIHLMMSYESPGGCDPLFVDNHLVLRLFLELSTGFERWTDQLY